MKRRHLTRRQALLHAAASAVVPALAGGGSAGTAWATETDDNPDSDARALQAAMTPNDAAHGVAPPSAVDLGGRDVGVSQLRLAPFVRLRNGTLHRSTDSAGALVTIMGDTPLQTTETPLLEDLRLLGWAGKQRSGTGLMVGNHASFRCREIGLEGFEVGYRHDGAQFGQFDSLKAYDNCVGFHMANKAVYGGNNSNDYHGLQAVQNIVGVIVDARRFAPSHSNCFYNPQVLGNTICGMAFFGPDTAVGTATIIGYANEANAGSTCLSFDYDGMTIKRSSLYCRRFHLVIVGGFCAEARADPNILLEDASRLEVIGLQGYGSSEGCCIRGDRTSAATISGVWDCNGSVNCLESFSGTLGSGSQAGLLAGPLPRVIPDGYGKALATEWFACQKPLRGASITRAGGGADILVRMTPENGSGVQFDGLPLEPKGRVLVSMEITPSADCEVSIRIYPNQGATRVSLFGGRRTRLIYWTNPAHGEGVRSLVLYGLGQKVTTVLQIRNGIAVTGDAKDPVFRVLCSKIIAGGPA